MWRRVGSTFRATRRVRGRPQTFEHDVLELRPPERVRLVNETGGTRWDSTYTIRPRGSGSELTLTLDARADRVVARVLNRLIAPVVRPRWRRSSTRCPASPWRWWVTTGRRSGVAGRR